MARETVQIEGLDQLLERLKALPPEVVSKRGGPVRTAVRKGAVVIQKQMQANIRAFVSEPNSGGWPDESTGLMERSVKPIRMKAHRGGLKGESYLVTIPRRVRYPADKRTPSGIPVAVIARIHEYGPSMTFKRGPLKGRTIKYKERRWARNAFHAKKGEAAEVMRDELLKGVDRVVRKLERGR